MTPILEALRQRIAQLVEGDPAVDAANMRLAEIVNEVCGGPTPAGLDIEAAVNALVGEVIQTAFELGVAFGRSPWQLIFDED